MRSMGQYKESQNLALQKANGLVCNKTWERSRQNRGRGILLSNNAKLTVQVFLLVFPVEFWRERTGETDS